MSISYQGSTSDNLEIRVYDLAQLLRSTERSDRKKAWRLFDQAQAIYHSAYPKPEREPRKTFKYDLKSNAKSLERPDDLSDFCYFVPVVDDQAVGITIFEFFPYVNAVVVFGSYSAVHEDFRQNGVSRLMFSCFEERIAEYHRRSDLNIQNMFAEVEQPDGNDNITRNSILPHLLHKYLGLGGAIVLDDDNVPKILPYFHPGVIRRSKHYPKIPLVPAFAQYHKNKPKRIEVEPGTVVVDGVIPDPSRLPKLDLCDTYNTIKVVLEHYLRFKHVHNPEQVDKIKAKVAKALEKKRAYLIPLEDTKGLEFA
ncbi:MAG: hypothetical protein ABII01_01740 [Candidatus Woesearchaeota archaeon]